LESGFTVPAGVRDGGCVFSEGAALNIIVLPAASSGRGPTTAPAGLLAVFEAEGAGFGGAARGPGGGEVGAMGAAAAAGAMGAAGTPALAAGFRGPPEIAGAANMTVAASGGLGAGRGATEAGAVGVAAGLVAIGAVAADCAIARVARKVFPHLPHRMASPCGPTRASSIRYRAWHLSQRTSMMRPLRRERSPGPRVGPGGEKRVA
jgi:hypothetical protein